MRAAENLEVVSSAQLKEEAEAALLRGIRTTARRTTGGGVTLRTSKVSGSALSEVVIFNGAIVRPSSMLLPDWDSAPNPNS